MRGTGFPRVSHKHAGAGVRPQGLLFFSRGDTQKKKINWETLQEMFPEDWRRDLLVLLAVGEDRDALGICGQLLNFFQMYFFFLFWQFRIRTVLFASGFNNK